MHLLTISAMEFFFHYLTSFLLSNRYFTKYAIKAAHAEHFPKMNAASSNFPSYTIGDLYCQLVVLHFQVFFHPHPRGCLKRTAYRAVVNRISHMFVILSARKICNFMHLVIYNRSITFHAQSKTRNL